MEITEVKVFPVEEEKLKAFVSIVFDRCFMVNDIKVIRGKDGLFISMPSRRKKNGRFKDVAHPLNNETRQSLERVILAEYERALSGEEAVERGPAERIGSAAAASGEADGAHASAGAGEREGVATAPKEETGEGEEGSSLEEVAELHLRDSFWST